MEIIPLKKSEYFRERYQNVLGLKDVELLAKDLEEYLDKKPRDLDSIIILLFCYVKIHEMDKAEAPTEIDVHEFWTRPNSASDIIN